MMKQRLLVTLIPVFTVLSVLAEAEQPAGEKGSPFGPMLLIGGIFVVMYFLMIRPQQKKQKQKQQMIGAIEVGDKIITAGGLYGEVKQVKENSVRVQIDDHTRVELTKSSIANVIQKANAPLEAEVV